MGLFSKTQVCDICQESGEGTKIKDGFICNKCGKKSGGFTQPPGATLLKDVKNSIKYNEESYSILERFVSSKSIDGLIEFDNENELFKISALPLKVYSYEKLLEYELLEDGERVTKGGLGSTLTGGLLFGGTGAIVGSVLGKKKTKTIVSSLKIKVTLKDLQDPVLYIGIIGIKTNSDSMVYKNAIATAQEILSMFSAITDKANQANKEENINRNLSMADEIFKLKGLMEEGIISKEQFEIEKNKLLS